MLKFLTAESIIEQMNYFRWITGACARGTHLYVCKQGFEFTDKAITIEMLRNLPENPYIEKFLRYYTEWLHNQIMNPDLLGYLPSEDAWVELAKNKVVALENKRRAYLHRHAKRCCYEEAAYYHMLHFNWSLDQFVQYINGVKSIVNKYIDSSTTGELMTSFHYLYCGRDAKISELKRIGVTIYGDANYNDIYHIVGVIIDNEIKSRLKTFNFNNIPFDELQKVLRYSDMSLIKSLCDVNIVDWNDAYKWASVLRSQIKDYIEDKLSVRVSTFTLGDVWK